MLSAHESVAIAQIVFYVPLIPVTIYILVRNWPIGARISRMTWFTLALLSIMRFMGGILVIAEESYPYSKGLIIATVVILNIGLIPLIMSAVGMIGIVLSSSVEKHTAIYKMMKLFRILFVTALSHITAGAVLSLDGHSVGDTLVKVAYIIFTSMIAIIIAIIVYLWLQKKKLALGSLIYLRGATIAIPFLILRIIYGVLSAFLSANTWSPLDGSAVAFALMALLPEYITIAIYEYIGFQRFQKNVSCSEEVGNGGA